MAKDRETKKKYYATDEEKVQKKLAEIGTGDFFKPKEGKNIVRILPPWSKEGIWYKESVIHYGFKTESGKDRGYPCLKLWDEECPICEKIEKLKKEGPEGKELADRIRPRIKYYANIIDYKTGKVVIWGFSAKTLGILLSYSGDPDYGDISHPEKGYDVIIERTGTGQTDTRYAIRCRPKPTAIEIEGWEDQLKDLDEETAEKPDIDKLEELLDGKFGDGGSKKSKDDDDDSDKTDDDDEDAPAKNKKKSSKEDDDDDDPPAKNKKSNKIEKGDYVEFKKGKKTIKGKVTKVDDDEEVYTVKDSDGEKHEVDFDDAEKSEEDDD